MSRSIKSLKKLKSMVGQEVKVCTLDDVVGICLVTEDDEGNTCLISKDKALSEARYFWKIEDGETIKDCTAEYITGHYCCHDHQLINELEWVTSSVPRKKTAVKSEAKPSKETKEEFILEPKTVEELWAKAPCKVRLSDGQIGYAETEAGRKEHATVYFKKGFNGTGIGWKTKHPPYKRGWHVNCKGDFEMIFGKKDEKPVKETKKTKTVKPTKGAAFKPLSIKQLEENMPCYVLLKDGQIGYADYYCGTPIVYFNTPVDKTYGWFTDRKDYKCGWYIDDEEDFEAVFEVSEGKLAQSAEPSLQEVLKEILETLKEIKNEIAKR